MPANKIPAKRRYINPDDFHIARRRAGLDRLAAAEMLDVDERTIKNWEGGKSPIPYAAFRVMRLAGGYKLLDEGWEGWAIWQGKLYSPSGRSFEPYELNYLANYLQMARLFIASHRAAPSSAVADQSDAVASASSATAENHIQPAERDGASCATAQAGARPRHDGNVVYVSFSQQKGGDRTLTDCGIKERL